MSAVEERLAAMGYSVPDVVPPVAAYVPALRQGDWVFVSGQLPMRDGAMPATGKVGDGPGQVSPEAAKQLAAFCALNGIAAVKSVIGDLDKVVRIVKVVGFVASAPGFNGQPAVINGASELMGEVFGPAGAHARSAVGVSELPLNAPVEVELIVEVV